MDEQRKYTEVQETGDDPVSAASEEVRPDAASPEEQPDIRIVISEEASRADPDEAMNADEDTQVLSRATGVYEIPFRDGPAGFSDGDLIRDAAADPSLMDSTREWDEIAKAVRGPEEPGAVSEGTGEEGSEDQDCTEDGDAAQDEAEINEAEDRTGTGAEGRETGTEESEEESDTEPDSGPAEGGDESDDDPGEDESEDREDGSPEDGSVEEAPEDDVDEEEPEDARDGDEPAPADEYAGFPYKHIDRKPKKRRKKHPMARLLLFVALIVAAAVFLTSSLFDIKKIEVTGNRYFTDSEIISMADATKGGNIFRLAESASIKRRLLENPYFTDVKVKRKLPSTEVIEVEERRQVAAVPYGDQYVVIDSQGVVLRKTPVDPEVTLLKGMTISRMEVSRKIKVEESDILKSTLKMLSSMRKGDFYFKQINVSKTHIEAYITDMLVVKGDPDKVEAAIKNGGLQKVVNKLFKKKIKRGTIDISRENYISSSPEV